MTDPEVPDLSTDPALPAEREQLFTLSVADQEARNRGIAAIYTLAEWLFANPQAPIPSGIDCHVAFRPLDRAHEAVQAAYVLDLATTLDAEVVENDNTLAALIDVTSATSHGVTITYRAAVNKLPPEANPRYVARAAQEGWFRR